MIYKTIVSLFLVFLFLVSANAAHAESDKASPAAAESEAAEEEVNINALLPFAPQTDNKGLIDSSFVKITYPDLYRLAMSHQAYGDDNDEAIDVFLMITECALYERFFSNEFEWDKIRASTRKYLEDNREQTSRYYEYTQPIELARYDNALQGFPVVGGDNQFKGVKNLEFADFESGQTDCRRYNLPPAEYPPTGVLNLDSPFTLSFVRVPPKLAQTYVAWRNENAEASNRNAFIRYRIRVDGLEGIKTISGKRSFSFTGRLLRVDVYADPEMMLPLYNQVF